MKILRASLMVFAICLAAFLWTQLHAAREALISAQIRNQIDRVKERALAFYQLELNRKVLDHGFKGGGRSFELRIVIPSGKEKEFKEWMKDYGFELPALGSRNHKYSGGGEDSGELFWKLEYE